MHKDLSSHARGRARRLTGAAFVAAMVPALMFGSSSTAAPSFGAPVRMTGGAGFEQGINVAPTGEVYVDEPAAFPTFEHRLWRSDNGGVTFKRLTFGAPASRMPGGGDTDVVVTEDGRVYFLDLWLGSNSIAASLDKGETWTYGQPLTTIPPSDRQWLALGTRNELTGLDTLYATYSWFPLCMTFARSDDGGLTWPFQRPIPYVTCGDAGATGELVSDGDFVGVAWENNGDIYWTHSTDAGLTWTDRITVTDDHQASADIYGAALSGQDVYTTFIDRADGYATYVVRSRDRGLTWDAPVKVSPGGGSAVFSWVAARGSKVAAVWYETLDGSGLPDSVPDTANWKVKYAESNDFGDTWTAPIAVSSTVLTGKVCISGLACTTGEAPGDRSLGDFLTVTLDADGKALIAYRDGVADAADAPFAGGYVIKQN